MTQTEPNEQTGTTVLAVPSIHWNGTGRETLLREYQAGIEALDHAITAVGAITVHGRDYYVQGPDATREAVSQAEARILKLYDVQRDLQAIYEALYFATFRE